MNKVYLTLTLLLSLVLVFLGKILGPELISWKFSMMVRELRLDGDQRAIACRHEDLLQSQFEIVSYMGLLVIVAVLVVKVKHRLACSTQSVKK